MWVAMLVGGDLVGGDAGGWRCWWVAMLVGGDVGGWQCLWVRRQDALKCNDSGGGDAVGVQMYANTKEYYDSDAKHGV